jgi:hypothetical protein
MEEQTFELTLKLNLPEKTLKKLKSFAMLSGMGVSDLEAQLISQVEPQISGYFDRILTDSIVEKLSELDGIKLTLGEKQVPVESDSVEHTLSGDDDV